MKQFPVRETEHFQIKIPRERDPVLGELLAMKAEEAFVELERDLGFTPDLPVIYEVFEESGIFAARVTGMPRGMPTAVCLGPVIAMRCPPSGRHEDEAFQWYHVLRHELAHVFTLGWTKNRIPRWFTEGISVYYEGSSRVRHDPALSAAMASQRLLEIEHLNRGFSRPEYPGQVSNSYAQSGLVVRMIMERWGMEMLANMLSLFAEGMTTDDVIPEATGMSLEEFNTVMFEYLDRVLHEEWRARPQLDPSRLDYYHRRIERSPDDADLHLRAAQLHLAREEPDEAREHAEEALELDEDNVEALELLARIALESDEEDEAMAFAQRALEAAGSERYYPRLVFGLVHESRGEKEQAIEEFEKAKSIRRRYVWNNNPYEKLAELYEETGREEKALAVRAELLELRETDFQGNIKLARAYLKEGTREKAILVLQRTLEIVPFNARVHGMLGKALLDEASAEQALKVLGWAVELEPGDALYRLDLATAYARTGKNDEALEHATEAARLDPDLTEAEELIKELGG
jgi:tetratricopeptide (TPR) repeat protein